MKQFELFVSSILHCIHLSKPLLIEVCLFAIALVEIFKFFMDAIATK
jgi:hypothetical protein